MNWAEAEINLRENIKIYDHLEGFGHYKIVSEVPPYTNRNGEEAFRIKVGKKSYIIVTLEMLESIFHLSIQNLERKYDRYIFKSLFPIQLYNKPCYVHAIGKLFVKAGIANQNNSRSYEIL